MSSVSHPYKLRLFLLVVFTISGFSGLIYESIWTHYLKLLLGHAAYAQTIVLAIFMGGMALGAFLASKFSTRIKKPLLAYAVIEGIVGLLALTFHPVFTELLELLFQNIIPSLGSPFIINITKWGMASLLILPQSILLGTTFPIMSTGIIRLTPAESGPTLGALYFTNSIGAAIGVLASAFVLIPAIGLPGTVFTAGVVNILLAITVWLVTKQVCVTVPLVRRQASGGVIVKGQHNLTAEKLFLLAAFLTGAASFIYEISWIRMLSQVLGTTFQAFEIMLSAFIAGLAFGGLWINRHIRRISNTIRYAAYVQIIMGVLALMTIPAYNYLFDVMGFMLHSLTKTDSGYVLFNFVSHAIALAIMVPATFMAGMTLPLFTYALLQEGFGEESIGRVYAANTIGAIFGVLLSVNILMPLIGVKWLFELGVLIDISLGLGLLYYLNRSFTGKEVRAATISAIIFLFIVVVGADFNPLKQASGVYRHGKSKLTDVNEIIFNKDGKTATVVVDRNPAGVITIRTNGKPDASAYETYDKAVADEITQKMAAILPLAIHSQAKTAAIIGMGSGMTTSTLLSAKTIERVDTIEIEAAMIEGARLFGPKVARAYDDPRSRIYVEDAKTFFSSHASKYDILISEPSNPWVTGVASLFTSEFYNLIKNYLNTDGLLVQWLQLYETNLTVLSSVFRALSLNFQHFAVYNTDDGNILIVASTGRELDSLNSWIFSESELVREMQAIGIFSIDDIGIRRIANEYSLRPLFRSYGAPANSDYFPFVGLNAPKSRYLGENVVDLSWIRDAGLPVFEIIDNRFIDSGTSITVSPYFKVSEQFVLAKTVIDRVTNREALAYTVQLPEKLLYSLQYVITNLFSCSLNDSGEGLLHESLLELAKHVNPFSGKSEAEGFWQNYLSLPCYDNLSTTTRNWIELHASIGRRDRKRMVEFAYTLLNAEKKLLTQSQTEYLLLAGLAGLVSQGEKEASLKFWNTYASRYSLSTLMPLSFRTLLAQLQ